MRKRSLILATAVALTFMASTQVVQAQQPMVVNVPFDFMAGGVNLPAGEYLIKTWGPTSSLFLTNRADAETVILPSNAAVSANIQTESKLMFHRYGDRYFLAQIWTAGSASGRELPKSEREKEMALSAKAEARGVVVLTASLTK